MKLKFTKTYKIDFSAEPKPRNVFILMDGTWNDETGRDDSQEVTNIVKLYRLLGEDSDTQISRYFRGIGNDEDNKLWSRVTQGAFGTSEQKIRDDAYTMICKNYQPGDRIFIFGFSRGAASARMLASDLHKKGIPDEITITTKPYANRRGRYIEYRFVNYEAKGKKHPVAVEFLGVWDTVFAFGIPVKILGIPFHNYDLFKDKTVAKNVKRAVHLVAIDETRVPFQPTLMNHDPDVVHEVWFPGVHTDVGGGYKDDELGRITLKYMLDQLDKHCQINELPPVQYKPIREDFTKQMDQKHIFHFHGLGFQKSFRMIHVLKNGKPDKKIQPLIHDSYYQIQNSSEAFSYQKKKKLFGKPELKLYRFIYVPANVKALNRDFDYVGDETENIILTERDMMKPRMQLSMKG